MKTSVIPALEIAGARSVHHHNDGRVADAHRTYYIDDVEILAVYRGDGFRRNGRKVPCKWAVVRFDDPGSCITPLRDRITFFRELRTANEFAKRLLLRARTKAAKRKKPYWADGPIKVNLELSGDYVQLSRVLNILNDKAVVSASGEPDLILSLLAQLNAALAKRAPTCAEMRAASRRDLGFWRRLMKPLADRQPKRRRDSAK